MECKRLNRMIRDWYVQVQDETLAPARMVEFMQDHAETCDTCFVDPNIKEEIAKITAIVLPPSKMTKKPKKKAVPLEPTAAALAAIEANVEKAPVADDDDDLDEEIEVGDDDDDTTPAEKSEATDVGDETEPEEEESKVGDGADDANSESDKSKDDPSLADADLE